MKPALTFLTALLLTPWGLRAADTTLWYDKPATNWMTEALPVGNGDLGAMVFGKTEIERVQFNEKSLWTGNESDTGSYQPFGDLFIELGHTQPQEYRRELDLARGAQTVSYVSNGVRYRREIIASYPAGVVAMRFTADQPGAFTGKLRLTDMHAGDVLAEGNRLTATGVLNNGLDYESQVLVLPEGGKVVPVLEPGFDNRPVKRVRPEVPVLDGTKDAYLSLRASDKPVFGYYAQRSNDDATTRGMPLVIDGAWFDRGVSFEAPNDFSFALGAKYQWLTFHARIAEGATLQIILDGKAVQEIAATKAGQYTAIPVSGVKTLTFKGASLLDPKDKRRPEILLGHLRVSPAKTEPAKDDGLVRGWKSLPGFDAMIPLAALAFEKCDSLTVLLSAKTSYLADASKGWRGPHPHASLTALLDKAARSPFPELLAAHEKDYRTLFDRVSLELGKISPQVANLPTDERLKRYAQGEADPALEQLSFQFGRYLLIACSRAGGLPANLQGVWNTSTSPPWRGDYHSNIDLQMCYWSAETTGLGECHVPFTDFIAAQAPTYRANMQRDQEMAKRFAGHRGWTIRTETGVFGASSWELNTSANAWYCHHLWQHFEFGQDREYLRTRAYPMMKEVCEFWIDHLITMPDGRLATPDGWSAEWGPREPAVTYDQELIWDLFTNTVAAADVLGVDKALRDQIAAMRDKLVTPSIGQHGQLKEWFEDIDDMTSRYRHVSHLWALYPGKQITPRGTPEWSSAAKVSLDARGDNERGKDAPNGAVSFSLVWKANFWARLNDPERAYKLLHMLVRPQPKQGSDNFVGSNLVNRLFQLEGQFGYTSAIAEMLLQSHAGEIHLLPALPKAWPEGKVTGLRARGGFTVDLEWKNGTITTYRITSAEPREVKVRFNGETKTIRAENTHP
ncbi:MAG: glycoside hydrolase N-terminal domain-containing protein [Chthoniobacteraceae bacterium]